jgi:hypothetical protein
VQSLTLAFIAVAVLAGMTALARRASPPGRRKDVLSVLLVVLALIAAFLLCFAAGSLVRGERARTVSQAGIRPLPIAGDHAEA